MKVDADQFARLCVQAGHEPEAIRVTVRKRYPEADPADVVERALAWLKELDEEKANQPK